MTEARETPSLAFGLALSVVAGVFLWFARDIQASPLEADGDPGSRALPMTLGWVLLAGGIVQIAGALRSAGKDTPRQAKAVEHVAAHGKMMLLVAGIALYLLAIPNAGFWISSTAFVALCTWWLGARWWAALLAAGVLMAVVYGLFVLVFRVQLP